MPKNRLLRWRIPFLAPSSTTGVKLRRSLAIIAVSAAAACAFSLNANAAAKAPRLALASTSGTSSRLHGVVHNTSGRFDIVGNHTYVKKGNSRWVTGPLSAKARGTIA
jgi:outer membrane lipoprotein-sorting protein